MSVYYNGNEVSEIVYGTGDTGKLNFKAIGYSDVPEPLKDGLEYAKEIQENWKGNETNLSNKFKGHTKLVFLPPIDFSKATNMNNCFSDCYCLSSLPEEVCFSNVTSMANCFASCYSLGVIPPMDTSKVTNFRYCFLSTKIKSINLDTTSATNMDSTFYGCIFLKEVNFTDTSKVTDFQECFRGCSELEEINPFSTSSATTLSGLFMKCSKLLQAPILSTSSVKSMSECFSDCTRLMEIPDWDYSNVTNFSGFCSSCMGLTVAREMDTSKATNLGMFYNCKNLKRIEGLSFKSMGSISYSSSFIFSSTSNNNVTRYILLKDIGTNSSCTKLVMTSAQVWGIDSDEIPDARQSLIDSLLTYSFDRRAAGYSDCTIQLYKDVKAVLTSEELASIQAKGYIIS